MYYTVKGFSIVSKAKVDVFMELSWLFDDPTDVGNLISGSSAFSKSSFNIRVRFPYLLTYDKHEKTWDRDSIVGFTHLFSQIKQLRRQLALSNKVTF